MTAPTTATKPAVDKRIPVALAKQSILADFCRRYLEVFDEITKYNGEVLAEKDAEWNASKVLERARALGRPTDKDTKPNDDIKTALEAWEALVNQVNLARKAVLDITSKELGITLSATATRDPEVEAPMKERRTFAVEIGKQLSVIAEMTTDENATAAVLEFLSSSPLPAIGRDQTTNFGKNEKATPKYRVSVQVFDKDGKELFNEAGFTKASLALPPYYERGKALKSEDLRKIWEKGGEAGPNSPEETKTNKVEFVDESVGLHFVITKK